MFKFLVFFTFFAVIFCQSDDEYDPPINDEPPINNRPGRTGFRCPAGWRYLAEYGKCLLATPIGFSWHEAEAYCQKLDAHLLSVHGLHEVKRAFEMLEQNFWVGLYKSVNQQENTWRFANNETLHYTPLNGYTGQNCGFGASDGAIYSNHPCDTTKLPGICQIYAFA